MIEISLTTIRGKYGVFSRRNCMRNVNARVLESTDNDIYFYTRAECWWPKCFPYLNVQRAFHGFGDFMLEVWVKNVEY